MRKRLYEILARRDVDFCKMCGVPASEKQLVIDHIDNNNSNNRLGNLQLLCRHCNYLKNPRQPVDSCVRSESVSVGINRTKEPEFRKYVYEEIVRGRTQKFKGFVLDGAERIGVSPVTTTRYLQKMVASTGALKLGGDGLEFKERSVLENTLSTSELGVIDSIIQRINAERQTNNPIR